MFCAQRLNLIEWETEEVGVVDFGAFVLVEGLGGFATVARGETEFGAMFVASPGKHSFPEGGADALAATGLVGDEVLEISNSTYDGSHDDG